MPPTRISVRTDTKRTITTGSQTIRRATSALTCAEQGTRGRAMRGEWEAENKLTSFRQSLAVTAQIRWSSTEARDQFIHRQDPSPRE